MGSSYSETIRSFLEKRWVSIVFILIFVILFIGWPIEYYVGNCRIGVFPEIEHICENIHKRP
jgi:hypothetical protein